MNSCKTRRFIQRATLIALASVALIALGLAQRANAGRLPFEAGQSAPYLLIGMGPANSLGGRPGVGQAVNVNNFELGANKAPVSSTSGFLVGGSSGGPGLLGNVPNIPLNARPVDSGVLGGGNVAITSPGGVFNLQDVGVYGNLGIRTEPSAAAADVGSSNSFFNDPHLFPNTFTPTGFTNPGVNNNTGGFGADVNPNDAMQSTRIDEPNSAGVTGNVDFTLLRAELAAAAATIPTLPATGVLDVSGSGGQIQSQTRTILLAPGVNVIDIITGGGDFKLDNSSLVIDGPAGSFAIFRVPDHANFLISNGNVLIGNGGIGLNNVLVFSDRPDNASHFNFNNSVLNGVAFWSLGAAGGEIVINDSQGCTQLVADKINLNDVRFNRCSIPEPAAIPEPSSAVLLVFGLALAGVVRRRMKMCVRT